MSRLLAGQSAHQFHAIISSTEWYSTPWLVPRSIQNDKGLQNWSLSWKTTHRAQRSEPETVTPFFSWFIQPNSHWSNHEFAWARTLEMAHCLCNLHLLWKSQCGALSFRDADTNYFSYNHGLLLELVDVFWISIFWTKKIRMKCLPNFSW